MKLKALILFIFFFPPYFQVHFFAQAGIYLTAEDFENEKISCTKIEKYKYRLKVNNLFRPNTIKVIIGDTVFKFSKDSIFAYRDNEKNTYRLYNRNEYQILNSHEHILLYGLTVPIHAKGFQTATSFYFSAGSHSNIFPLSKINLKKAFPSEATFHELIDMYFTCDAQLMSYDTFYKVFKINRIYELNKKNK